MAEKAWHALETEQVINELKTETHRGLSDAEVNKRLEQYGYNEFKKEKQESPLALFFSQFKNVLMIILLVAIILSAAVGEALDAAVIAVIVVFCAVLGFIQEYRASRALEALKKMLSPVVTVLREGKEEEVASRELVPGDVLLVEAGDRVPADARLVELHSLMCDEAPLTGESVPVSKDTVSLAENASVGERKNIIFTGTTVTYGRGKAVVISTGMNTEFGKIAEQVTEVKTERTPLEKRTGEIGKWLGIMALAVCCVLVVVSLVREGFWGPGIDTKFIISVVMFAVALAVAAVPEALPAIVTGALAIGVHQMAQRNALVRKMPAVETLGCTTVICSDKTGTLTKGEMTVRQIFAGDTAVEVTGAGYAPEGAFKTADGSALADNRALQSLLLAGLLCNDATLAEQEGKWLVKGDPTEGALIVAAAKAGMHQAETRLENLRVEEIPFSSERKRMTTVHNIAGGKKIAYLKGAPEVVLERCAYIQNGDGEIAPLGAVKTGIQKESEAMSNAALRVLALACRELADGADCTEDSLEENMVFLGLVGMMDPPRAEAIEAIEQCQQVGIKTVMITGDHRLTAVAIAREMGIFSGDNLVLTGAELDNMTDAELEKIVDRVTVYARVSPMDKLKIVKAWKARGEVVAMTGDGVNDAPALKHADIGIAMGITGTDVTKEAADMVLSDDNFATIVKAVERGRWIYDNIKKYLTYLLQCNIVEVLVIGGIVLWKGPEFLPLVAAAILYINLATDGLPALALGVSPPDPDVMLRPPRNPKESVFSRDVRFFMLPAILIQAILFYFLFFHQLDGTEDGIRHARTELFFLFIIVEFVVALACRSLTFSIIKVRPHKWLLIALAWEIALIAVLVQFPVIRQAFGINMPSLYDLGIVAGMSALVFVVMEITKVFIRRKLAPGRMMRR